MKASFIVVSIHWRVGERQGAISISILNILKHSFVSVSSWIPETRF